VLSSNGGDAIDDEHERLVTRAPSNTSITVHLRQTQRRVLDLRAHRHRQWHK
jgi:hypothetical protein